MAALKYSRQRESIKNFLMSRNDHPTADVVYHQLRIIYPNISLGTVYRNLALLTDLGEIKKLNCGDGVDHFDGHIQPHYHVICTKCHKVTDLDMKYQIELDKAASSHFKGKIQKHTCNFYGICDECLSKESKA